MFRMGVLAFPVVFVTRNQNVNQRENRCKEERENEIRPKAQVGLSSQETNDQRQKYINYSY